MGKVFHNKKCDFCGYEGTVIEVWGKYYCKACYDKKPKKGKGHGGLLKDKYIKEKIKQTCFTEDLRLQRVTKGNKIFASLYLEHYPHSKGIVGRQINYIIWNEGRIVGIIGACSPPLNYKKFREYFNTTERFFLNNNVFKIIRSKKNQATQILKLFRKTIKKDYEEKYGDELIGLVTFVEPPRTGSIYKADNWDYLGMTKGINVVRRGNLDKWVNKEYKPGTKKHIFAKKLK